MKRIAFVILLVLVAMVGWATASSDSNDADTAIVETQQGIYQDVLPLPLYDYSIPRDVFIQISDVVTLKAYVTYSIITSITGVLIFDGPTIGYALPADTSLTNPLVREWGSTGAVAVEQAEPNGLFASKNTDATWVLFLNADGTVNPVYTEMKVTTFPFAMRRAESGEWIRADAKPSEFTVDIGQQ